MMMMMMIGSCNDDGCSNQVQPAMSAMIRSWALRYMLMQNAEVVYILHWALLVERGIGRSKFLCKFFVVVVLCLLPPAATIRRACCIKQQLCIVHI